MTTFATNEDTATTLAILDEREREAWSAYADASRDLEGVAYDQAEASAWEHLQHDLLEIEGERVALTAPPPAATQS